MYTGKTLYTARILTIVQDMCQDSCNRAYFTLITVYKQMIICNLC